MEEKGEGLLSGSVPAWLLVLALGSGVGSGLLGLSQDTSDRYHASRAERDFKMRDERIQRLESELAAHLEHAAKYTQVIIQIQHENRELKRKFEDHIRQHLDGVRTYEEHGNGRLE